MEYILQYVDSRVPLENFSVFFKCVTMHMPKRHMTPVSHLVVEIEYSV